MKAEPDMKKLVTALLVALNVESPGWVDEAQEHSEEKDEAIANVLSGAGYTEKDSLWDDLVDELSSDVVWVPGHYERLESVKPN